MIRYIIKRLVYAVLTLFVLISLTFFMMRMLPGDPFIGDKTVSATAMANLNRQLIATRKTVGQYKVDAMEQRLHDINPNVVIRTYKMFYMPDTAD